MPDEISLYAFPVSVCPEGSGPGHLAKGTFGLIHCSNTSV